MGAANANDMQSKTCWLNDWKVPRIKFGRSNGRNVGCFHLDRHARGMTPIDRRVLETCQSASGPESVILSSQGLRPLVAGAKRTCEPPCELIWDASSPLARPRPGCVSVKIRPPQNEPLTRWLMHHAIGGIQTTSPRSHASAAHPLFGRSCDRR